MSTASRFTTTKIKLLGQCTSCKGGRLRQEQKPVEEVGGGLPKNEMVRIFCLKCGYTTKAVRRKILKY